MRLLEAIQVILEHLLSVFPGLVSAFNQVKGQKNRHSSMENVDMANWKPTIFSVSFTFLVYQSI